MKQYLPILLAFIWFAACKDDQPPTVINGNSSYGGSYKGMLYQHISGVDSNGVYKSDSSFEYIVDVLTVDDNTVEITLVNNSPGVTVDIDASGYFEFKDFNRTIDGNFDGDSIHLNSDATSGSYEPPQFYINTKLEFDGEKL